MKPQAREEDVRRVCEKIESMGFRAHPMPGAQRTAIGITGNPGPIEPAEFESLPGVAEAIRVSKPYKLVSREVKSEDSLIRVGPGSAGVSPAAGALTTDDCRLPTEKTLSATALAIGNRQSAMGNQRAGEMATLPGFVVGGQELAIIAGPCAIENREQALTAAEQVKKAGARLFRGGAFKPRTSPYSFQGLGKEGLEILDEVRRATGLLIVTETIDPENCDLVEQYADVLQVGARNMQNFSLLKRVGRSPKPVLLKRGMSATLEEFLMAAEYVLSEGNYNVILCERGVRTFADHTRNTLDLSVIPAVKRLSHLPILVDPSHGTGKRDKVIPLSRAAVAVGADGLIVEVHPQPERALSDGYQSLCPQEFEALMGEITAIAGVIGRTTARTAA
jgi:3-deoxy-7-phosphoheptulonate synthase